MRADYGYSEDDYARLRGSGVPEDERSPFQRDLDRLLYTGAFRRLAGKTQVVTPSEADFFRTRLTHTLEVAQVARRLAERINAQVLAAREAGTLDEAVAARATAPDGVVDPDLCEAAAVLHDLGHPPFGHAGEQALNSALDEFCGTGERSIVAVANHGSFDGNAQSVRMAARSLTHRQAGAGLELTRAALDSAIKYPVVHGPGVGKWSLFPTESEDFTAFIRKDIPTAALQLQTVEAQIMDWADDVAYSVHDLDDWFRAGFMPIVGLVGSTSELDNFAEVLVDRWKTSGRVHANEANAVDGAVRNLFQLKAGPFAGFQKALADGTALGDASSWDISEAIRMARSILFGEFLGAVDLVVRPEATADWPDRYAYTLRIDPDAKRRCNILRELLWVYVVGSAQMATHQMGQRRVVTELLEIHLRAAQRGGEALNIFPPETSAQLSAAGDDLQLVRCVVDFVSGMTDAYALRRHARLTGQDTPFSQFI